jgi:D-alanine-D-alanine ligase-like ATP-grasp enzyme
MDSSTCPYCGNNPVPHNIYWFNETLNILLTPIRQKILYNGLTRYIKKRRWDAGLGLFFLFLAEKLKIITRQKDIVKCKVRRAQVLWEEAQRRGINMEELLLFGRPFDAYWGSKRQETRDKRQEDRLVFSGLPRPAGYINRWLDLMDDKWLLKKKLMENNLPVPEGGSCSNWKQAKKVFEKIQEKYKLHRKIGESENQINPTSDFRLPISVIVKPRAGSRGRHTTTFVSSAKDLETAFKIAKQLCYWIMVEEQLTGPVYRATLVNFELCGVLRGDPPQVVGDGINAIEKLILIKNLVLQEDGPLARGSSSLNKRVKDVIFDDGMKRFLSRQGLGLPSVPEQGRMVNLSEKIGVNYGGSSSENFEICHPDNKELFVQAAKVLGDPIVGFDFIIADITKSWKEQKCGFIEVNSLPFINLHHDPLLGKPRNVAAKVWQMINW